MKPTRTSCRHSTAADQLADDVVLQLTSDALRAWDAGDGRLRFHEPAITARHIHRVRCDATGTRVWIGGRDRDGMRVFDVRNRVFVDDVWPWDEPVAPVDGTIADGVLSLRCAAIPFDDDAITISRDGRYIASRTSHYCFEG